MKLENPNAKKYEPKVVGKCPECGKDIVVKRSKNGKIYYGCTGFPDCKYYSWTNPAKDQKTEEN